MAKWCIRVLLFLLLSFGATYIPITVTLGFLEQTYTIIGIMFPIALSQIMAFSFTEVDNDTFVKRFRQHLAGIRSLFIIFFVFVSILLFAAHIYTNCIRFYFLQFDIKKACLVGYGYSLVYYIRNFISLAHLKDEIDDEIRKFKKSFK